MPAATEITQVLRTADDWPVWISQVNARLLAIGCRDYPSINASGGLELTPPTPPAHSAAGGSLDRRVRVPGEHGLLVWPHDRENLQYVKSKNEYLGFMQAVQRSIDPEMGFDVSEEQSFGELLAALRAHLDLDGGSRALVPQAKAEGSWVGLLRQDLRGKLVQDWGEGLVGMYRSVREYNIDELRSWRPHVDFVVSVNRFYPSMSGTIYLYLDRMQEEEGEPKADSFERLVRFGAGMIARLARTRGGSSIAGAPVRALLEASSDGDREDTEVGEAPGVPKLVEIRGESQSSSMRKRDGSRSGASPGTQDRERVEELQSDTALKAAKKAKKAHERASEGDAGASGSGTPAKKISAEKTAFAKKDKRSAESEAEKAKRETKERKAKKAMEKAKKKKEKERKDKEKKAKKKAASKPAPRLGCGICENSNHVTKDCGLLNLYRLYGDATRGMTYVVKGICKILVQNEAAERQRAEQEEAEKEENSEKSEASGDESISEDEASDYESSDQDESSDEEGPVTKSLVTKGSSKQGSGQKAPGKEDPDTKGSSKKATPEDESRGASVEEITDSSEDESDKCHICEKDGHLADKCPAFARYRQDKSAAKKKLPNDDMKRRKRFMRNQEEAPPIREEGSRTRDEAPPVQGEGSQGATCYVCDKTGHNTEICKLLGAYRRHGRSPRRISAEAIRRCGEWTDLLGEVRAQDEGSKGKMDACFVCWMRNHTTEQCGILRRHIHSGPKAKGSNPAYARRCGLWLKKMGQPPLVVDGARCVVCGTAGHAEDECKVLVRYRADGEEAKGLSGPQKRLCQVWLRNESASEAVSGGGQDPETPVTPSRYNLLSAGEPRSRSRGPGSGAPRVANGTSHVANGMPRASANNTPLAVNSTPRAANGTSRVAKSTPRVANGTPHAPSSNSARLPARPQGPSPRVNGTPRAAKGNPLAPDSAPARPPAKPPVVPPPQIATPFAPDLYSRCYICESPTHGTDACGSLSVYRKRGGKALGSMPKAYIDRCRVWMAGSSTAPSAPTRPGCEVCKSKGHAADGCSLLGLYRARGEWATVNEEAKSRCRAVLRKEQAKEGPVGPSVMCVICQAKGHNGKTCHRLKAWRRHDGDVWDLPDDVGNRCREWVEEEKAEIRGRLAERKVSVAGAFR